MDSSPKKAKLKLVGSNKPAIVAGGNRPSESMQPGKYMATCQTAKFVEKGSKLNALLLFAVTEGPHAGTALRQWIAVNEVNEMVGPGSKYYDHCELALKRPIRPREKLEPDAIFTGKLCVVEAGYSLKGLDNRNNPANALVKKYERDFLRVHRIVEVV